MDSLNSQLSSLNSKYTMSSLSLLELNQAIQATLSEWFDQTYWVTAEVSEARVVSDKETMTYSYYYDNVKPAPQTEGKKGYVCKICGYVYEGEELPEDYRCPICNVKKNMFIEQA